VKRFHEMRRGLPPPVHGINAKHGGLGQNMLNVAQAGIYDKQSTTSHNVHPEVREFETWLSEMVAIGKMRGLFTECCSVTPVMARHILDTYNTNNRPLRPSKIEMFARAMSDRAWRLTHQGLAFSNTKRLLDGQNRLSAVVRSQATVDFSIAFGQDDNAFEVLDTGGVRGGSDVLAICGYKNWNALAAAARLVAIIDGTVVGRATMQNHELLDYVAAHPELADATTPGVKLAKALISSSAAATCAAYFILTQSKHPERLLKFVDTVVDAPIPGQMLKFRDAMVKKTLDEAYRNPTDRIIVQCGSLVKVWNHWLRPRRASFIHLPQETFPTAD
jgi:hypothetical protein